MKPVYVASARVEVDKESQNMSPFPDSNSYDEFMDLENYLETQSKILQSETLALANDQVSGSGTLSRVRRQSKRNSPRSQWDCGAASRNPWRISWAAQREAGS